MHRFFHDLSREGKIALIGRANRARYVPAKNGRKGAFKNVLEMHRILRNADLAEDRVLDDIRKNSGIFSRMKENVWKTTEYAFTEMLNNAIEHSQSAKIDVHIKRSGDGVTFKIRDWGIGIFRNIKDTRRLATESEAIQELLKGKETTVPDRHSGEGIFFTSKAVDRLVLKASNKQVVFDNSVQDVFVRDAARMKGTVVECRVELRSQRILAKVFDEYMNEEFQFDRTTVRVHLFKVPGSFVSRSQARRMLVNLDRFRVVELDFKNVESIGQGFADEVFRVWARHHPDAKLEIRNARESVRVMIDHVRSTE